MAKFVCAQNIESETFACPIHSDLCLDTTRIGSILRHKVQRDENVNCIISIDRRCYAFMSTTESVRDRLRLKNVCNCRGDHPNLVRLAWSLDKLCVRVCVCVTFKDSSFDKVETKFRRWSRRRCCNRLRKKTIATFSDFNGSAWNRMCCCGLRDSQNHYLYFFVLPFFRIHSFKSDTNVFRLHNWEFNRRVSISRNENQKKRKLFCTLISVALQLEWQMVIGQQYYSPQHTYGLKLEMSNFARYSHLEWYSYGYVLPAACTNQYMCDATQRKTMFCYCIETLFT